MKVMIRGVTMNCLLRGTKRPCRSRTCAMLAVHVIALTMIDGFVVVIYIRLQGHGVGVVEFTLKFVYVIHGGHVSAPRRE